MDKILCDGDFGRTEKCENEAIFIARSNIDPIGCVYYCCSEHRDSFEKESFIIEQIKVRV